MKTLLTILAHWAVGPRCCYCGERRRGWRTLAAHQAVDHGDVA